VNGAGKSALLQNGPIDLAKSRLRGLIANADDDAIRMQKIQDGRAFAKKFGVRGNREAVFRVATVNCQGTGQLLPRLHGDRALLDHQLGAASLHRNKARSTINCAQVRIAILKRRRANTDENHIAVSYCFSHIRCEAQPMSFNIPRHNLA
jgi:hypothetical protein